MAVREQFLCEDVPQGVVHMSHGSMHKNIDQISTLEEWADSACFYLFSFAGVGLGAKPPLLTYCLPLIPTFKRSNSKIPEP